jgi:hypothetical protein
LIKGNYYRLLIDKEWEDAEGILLKDKFEKIFFTGPRDSISPNVKLWTIDMPGAATKDQLLINFNESLDQVLAENTLSLTDANGNGIKGKFRVNDIGSIVYFVPDKEWLQGIYTLQIESRLEDLAGNNPNRLFDEDLMKKQHADKSFYKREFEVR